MPDIIVPLLATITLQSYHTDAQRLLHDSTYRFWSSDELTDYANKARRKVAAETGCTRQLVPGVPLSAGDKSISTLNLLPGRRVVGLLDVYYWYSENVRPPLFYHPYSQFSRFGTMIRQITGIPQMWSQINGTLYIAPFPQTDTTIDCDASVEPLDLVGLTDTDTEIYSPFSECIKFYMCYLAKLKDSKREEANAFLLDYMRERSSISSSVNIRKLMGQ